MFWSLETVASVTLMHVAFSGPSSDGYVGWGIPASAGRMIGGNAVIVYPLSAAPTGELPPLFFLPRDPALLYTRLVLWDLQTLSPNLQERLDQ